MRLPFVSRSCFNAWVTLAQDANRRADEASMLVNYYKCERDRALLLLRAHHDAQDDALDALLRVQQLNDDHQVRADTYGAEAVVPCEDLRRVLDTALAQQTISSEGA